MAGKRGVLERWNLFLVITVPISVFVLLRMRSVDLAIPFLPILLLGFGTLLLIRSRSNIRDAI